MSTCNEMILKTNEVGKTQLLGLANANEIFAVCFSHMSGFPCRLANCSSMLRGRRREGAGKEERGKRETEEKENYTDRNSPISTNHQCCPQICKLSKLQRKKHIHTMNDKHHFCVFGNVFNTVTVNIERHGPIKQQHGSLNFSRQNALCHKLLT